MSEDNSERQDGIDWEPVAREQLGRALQQAYWDIETEHNRLKSEIEDGEEITEDDLNKLRRALNRYQNILEKDVTEITDSEPFGGHAVDNIRPSVLE